VACITRLIDTAHPAVEDRLEHDSVLDLHRMNIRAHFLNDADNFMAKCKRK
jgi:hypothetical protein